MNKNHSATQHSNSAESACDKLPIEGGALAVQIYRNVHICRISAPEVLLFCEEADPANGVRWVDGKMRGFIAHVKSFNQNATAAVVLFIANPLPADHSGRAV
jgi:hypothetical protein